MTLLELLLLPLLTAGLTFVARDVALVLRRKGYLKGD